MDLRLYMCTVLRVVLVSINYHINILPVFDMFSEVSTELHCRKTFRRTNFHILVMAQKYKSL